MAAQAPADGVKEFLRAPTTPPSSGGSPHCTSIPVSSRKYPDREGRTSRCSSALPLATAAQNVKVLEMAADCEQALGESGRRIGHLEDAIKTQRRLRCAYLRAMELHHADRGDSNRHTHIESISARARRAA